MAHDAAALLESPGDPLSRRELEYLLGAGLTGSLSMGNVDAAAGFRAVFAARYPAGVTPPFYLQLLLRVAEQTAGTTTPAI